MARRRGSITDLQFSRCFNCGESYSPAFFTTHEHVCNVCLADSGGMIPDYLRFDPANAHPPPQKEPATIKEDSVVLTGDIEELEVAERILMRRQFLSFVQRFKPNYMAGWVHRDICERLQRFLRDVEDKKSPRLLLCMPPRHGKSTLTSNFFPPYALGHHPEWEIIAASHTQGLALKFSGFVRDILRDPAYVATFPNTLLNPDSQSKEAWDTLEGGGYLAAGVNTGITGRGAHIFIIDDPVKDMEAADSLTQRDSTWEWYLSTASTRLAPGGGVLGIMTLWNEDDWGGRIIDISETGDGDKFEIVRYPAINEGYAELLAPNGIDIIHVRPNAANVLELEHFADHTVLRMPNEALHPDRYTLDALQKIKKNYYARGNQRIWSALYQQNPTIEDGNFFTKTMIRLYTHAPTRRYRTMYQAWDFAITERQTSDYTCGCCILQDEFDNLYVLDVKRFRSDDSLEIVETMIDYFVTWGANMIGVEDGQIWKTMKSQFEKRCKERRVYPPLETLVPLTDKKVRAMPLRGRMQLGKVHFAENLEWYDECRKELMSFPAGKHDDQVDALAWCVRLTLNHNAPQPPKDDAKKSWKDKLRKLSMESVGETSSMAA